MATEALMSEIMFAESCTIDKKTIPTFVIIVGGRIEKKAWDTVSHISILFWFDEHARSKEEEFFCLVMLGDYSSQARTLDLGEDDFRNLVAGKSIEKLGEQLFSLVMSETEHDRYIKQLADSGGVWAMALVGDGSQVIITINGKDNRVLRVSSDRVIYG